MISREREREKVTSTIFKDRNLQLQSDEVNWMVKQSNVHYSTALHLRNSSSFILIFFFSFFFFPLFFPPPPPLLRWAESRGITPALLTLWWLSQLVKFDFILSVSQPTSPLEWMNQKRRSIEDQASTDMVSSSTHRQFSCIFLLYYTHHTHIHPQTLYSNLLYLAST